MSAKPDRKRKRTEFRPDSYEATLTAKERKSLYAMLVTGRETLEEIQEKAIPWRSDEKKGEKPDNPAIPGGSALYGFQRVQCFFPVPRNYLMLCVGWSAANGNYGYYDEGCAGAFGGACGLMEVPWSVIPGYPYVWIYLAGPESSGDEVFPDLLSLVTIGYGYPDAGVGPDFSLSQTCGPWHCCDPFGGQFSAP